MLGLYLKDCVSLPGEGTREATGKGEGGWSSCWPRAWTWGRSMSPSWCKDTSDSGLRWSMMVKKSVTENMINNNVKPKRLPMTTKEDVLPFPGGVAFEDFAEREPARGGWYFRSCCNNEMLLAHVSLWLNRNKFLRMIVQALDPACSLFQFNPLCCFAVRGVLPAGKVPDVRFEMQAQVQWFCFDLNKPHSKRCLAAGLTCQAKSYRSILHLICFSWICHIIYGLARLELHQIYNWSSSKTINVLLIHLVRNSRQSSKRNRLSNQHDDFHYQDLKTMNVRRMKSVLILLVVGPKTMAVSMAEAQQMCCISMSY